MSNALELHDSRVGRIDITAGAVVHFSHAYIHKSAGRPGRDSGTGWSQEALLVFPEAMVTGNLPLPDTISEGFLEVGGIKHELIPLPFKRKVAARLYLLFEGGASIEIIGAKPYIDLLGKPIYLEDL